MALAQLGLRPDTRHYTTFRLRAFLPPTAVAGVFGLFSSAMMAQFNNPISSTVGHGDPMALFGKKKRLTDYASCAG